MDINSDVYTFLFQVNLSCFTDGVRNGVRNTIYKITNEWKLLQISTANFYNQGTICSAQTIHIHYTYII